jgi:phage-related protein (TIGR01555 family)
MVEPSLEDLVTEPGPSLGSPRYYRVTADAPALPRMAIHHSRAFKFGGIKLPYWQALSENLWDMSVLERLYDRMVAFDSATTGMAQLVYKSYLRTLKVKGMNQAVSEGGSSVTNLQAKVAFTATYQSNEGMSIIDSEDELQMDQHGSYTGIAECLTQLGQQLSGSLQIPLVRLFGQSPAGLNSTGESDLRTYYDMIQQTQVRKLLTPMTRIKRMIAQSNGIVLPDNFGFKFRGLWQPTEKEKSEMASSVSTAVQNVYDAGIIDRPTAMRELRHSGRSTGIFSNITDEDIKQAELEPPPMPGEEGMFGTTPVAPGNITEKVTLKGDDPADPPKAGEAGGDE